MTKNRLEAFSDGVIAIVITIMVLELKVPHTGNFLELQKLLPIFIGYIISFIYIGIYWNNHHHLFHVVQKITGSILWANLHLLFWLSLVPFATAWMTENEFSTWPVAFYGFCLLMSAIAYFILTLCLLANHEKSSALATALGKDFKGKISILFYLVAILLSYYYSVVAYTIYIIVALIWLIPDRRIEKVLTQ